MKALIALAALAALVAATTGRSAGGGMDWNRFGYDAARHNQAPGSGITAANVSKLKRMPVRLDQLTKSLLITPLRRDQQLTLIAIPAPAALIPHFKPIRSPRHLAAGSASSHIRSAVR